MPKVIVRVIKRPDNEPQGYWAAGIHFPEGDSVAELNDEVLERVKAAGSAGRIAVVAVGDSQVKNVLNEKTQHLAVPNTMTPGRPLVTGDRTGVTKGEGTELVSGEKNIPKEPADDEGEDDKDEKKAPHVPGTPRPHAPAQAKK